MQKVGDVYVTDHKFSSEDVKKIVRDYNAVFIGEPFNLWLVKGATLRELAKIIESKEEDEEEAEEGETSQEIEEASEEPETSEEIEEEAGTEEESSEETKTSEDEESEPSPPKRTSVRESDSSKKESSTRKTTRESKDDVPIIRSTRKSTRETPIESTSTKEPYDPSQLTSSQRKIIADQISHTQEKITTYYNTKVPNITIGDRLIIMKRLSRSIMHTSNYPDYKVIEDLDKKQRSIKNKRFLIEPVGLFGEKLSNSTQTIQFGTVESSWAWKLVGSDNYIAIHGMKLYKGGPVLTSIDSPYLKYKSYPPSVPKEDRVLSVGLIVKISDFSGSWINYYNYVVQSMTSNKYTLKYIGNRKEAPDILTFVRKGDVWEESSRRFGLDLGSNIWGEPTVEYS